MNWLSLQALAQISVERIINALPEGLLIAGFAWALLRVLRRQNSGTRFAVWFAALLTVAALPALAAFGTGRPLKASVSSFSSTPTLVIPSPWALVFFALWIAGTSLAVLRVAAGVWRLGHLRRNSTPIVAADIDPSLRETFHQICHDSNKQMENRQGSALARFIGRARSVTVATSEQVRVPAAIGLWRRTILLPAWTLRELPPEDLKVILLHEFEHFRRGDDWTNLIQKMVRGLLFFHPAVWWIEKQLAVEREMACDDAVLAATGNAQGYAACLVSLLEKSFAHRSPGERWAMAQAAVDRAREASLRLAKILDANRSVATRVWKPALAMLSVFFLACLMALPIAPRLVAFESAAPAPHAASAVPGSMASPKLSTAELENSELRSVAVAIPARIRTVETRAQVHVSRPAEAASPVAALLRTPSFRQGSPRFLADRPAASDELVLIGENQASDSAAEFAQPAEPEFQTLVFIEATQYGSSAAPLWNVQVWRLTFVSAIRERTTAVPPAKSI